jgi:hypothetical protein
LFIILIGPVNWYVVMRRTRKPALFLLTTPTVAIITSFLMLTYSFASEGFGTHARLHTLTVLDPASHRGVTWSRYSIYAGMAPFGGLRFDATTLVLPVAVPEGRKNASWSDGLRLRSGWLPARTKCSYVTCAQFPARWRVTVERIGGRYVLSNGLPQGMSTFIVKTSTGLVHAASAPPGSQTALSPVRVRSLRGALGDFERSLKLAGKRVSLIKGLSEKPEHEVLPLSTFPEGTFIAYLDGPLGAELGIERYSEELGDHVVVGIAEAR